MIHSISLTADQGSFRDCPDANGDLRRPQTLTAHKPLVLKHDLSGLFHTLPCGWWWARVHGGAVPPGDWNTPKNLWAVLPYQCEAWRAHMRRDLRRQSLGYPKLQLKRPWYNSKDWEVHLFHNNNGTLIRGHSWVGSREHRKTDWEGGTVLGEDRAGRVLRAML